MRDLTTTQLEARLRDALRGEADGVPFTLDATNLARRLAQRRRVRRLERDVLAVAAAVVVAVGAAAAFLLNNHSSVVPVGTTPTPSASAPASSSPPPASAPPSASAPVAAIPADCVRIDPSSESNLPAVNFAIQTGDDIGIPGIDGRHTIGRFSTTGTNWVEPDIAQAAYVDPATPFKLILPQGACVTTYKVQYGSFNGFGELPGDLKLLAESSAQMGVMDAVSLPGLGDGDWVVQARLDFWTIAGQSVNEDLYYRVEVNQPVPSPSPTAVPQPHSPTRPCGSPDLSVSTPPAVALTIPGAAPVAGEFGTTAWHGAASDAAGDVIPTGVISAGNGLDFALDIAGDVCADAWSISLAPIPTGQDGPPILQPSDPLVPEQLNPDQDLTFASENHFALSIVQSGEWIIHASLQYPDGDAQVYWRVHVRKMVIPSATATGTGTQDGVAACGASWEFAAGGGGGDSCGALGDAPTGALAAPAGSTLAVTTPGWSMSKAHARWVKASAYDGSQVPSTETSVSFAGEAATIAKPGTGDWVLLASFELHHGPDTWNIGYLFHVRVGG
jgi:hypothetical protein